MPRRKRRTVLARTPIDPTSKVKSWTFHSFDKREVLSVLYRSVFVKAEMAILLSFGEVSSPQMIVREDTEAMTISGRCKVGTSVAGQTKSDRQKEIEKETLLSKMGRTTCP